MAKLDDKAVRFGPFKEGRPIAKLQYHGADPVGYLHPILDLHERPMVSARLTAAFDDPNVAMVIQPEQYILLDEVRDRHALEYMRSHRDFVLLRVTRQFG